MRELRRKTQSQVEELSWPRKQGEEQAVLHHLVLTYLVHHGYSQTAEGFARCVGQEISEELASMRNRQHIQKLVLAGKIGEAISSVDQLYPTLLSLNQDLHFRLKVSPALITLSLLSSLLSLQVRQFIEMVSGADSLDADTDTSTSSANSSSIMETEETDNTPPAVNGTSSNNTSNGNIEADADNNTEENEMELEGGGGQANNRDNSILSNPAKFECLIR